MPHIPTPPKTSYMNTKMTTQQMLQKIQQISAGNIYNTPPVMDAQQIADIAIQQAKKVFQEYVEQEQQKRKTILTIENIDKIKGVLEFENHYEFTLVGTHSNQIETILLHRRQTTDKKYIMEYKGQTLWVSKDRLSTIAEIIECMREV
jgi:cell division protein YceG involved in septum cleavage